VPNIFVRLLNRLGMYDWELGNCVQLNLAGPLIGVYVQNRITLKELKRILKGIDPLSGHRLPTLPGPVLPQGGAKILVGTSGDELSSTCASGPVLSSQASGR
jgi:hypothetical protein